MSKQTDSQSDPAPRSEALLPADRADENLEVAEEVSLDMQSDSARSVGNMPPDTPVSKPAHAIAEALNPNADQAETHEPDTHEPDTHEPDTD